MKIFAYICLAILGFAVLWVVLFGLSFGGIHTRGFLRQQQNTVDRQVFEQSTSRVQGVRSNFVAMRLQYLTTEGGSKSVVCATLVRQFGQTADVLLPDQQAFLSTLRNTGC